MIAQLAFFGVLVVGAVVFSVYNDVQNVDRVLWQRDAELKNTISKLQEQLADLQKQVSDLQEQLAQHEEETTDDDDPSV